MEIEGRLGIWRIVLSALMLVCGMSFSAMEATWFSDIYAKLAWYVVAYLLVGWSVIRESVRSAVSGKDYFTEFTLMTIATVGAFAIGEYAEAVAVMLLYSVGELLQDKAVDHARDNIKSLVAMRPDKVSVVCGDDILVKAPGDVTPGDIIEVRPGERVALDGVLVSGEAMFDTAALTGESVPRLIINDGEVLAGMIACESLARVRVSRVADESTMSRILDMVQHATSRKAPTELLIRRFARIYTPVVILLAVLVVILPWLYSLVDSGFDYAFSEWARRSLVFLVISCPCALVISVPLSYFGGIGVASKRGVLFKGGNYLDAMTAVDTVVFDKTGTLTTGEFSVRQVVGLTADDVNLVACVERKSNHPIAKAIVKYASIVDKLTMEQVDEDVFDHEPISSLTFQHVISPSVKNFPGYGLEAGDWLIGTTRLLDREGVAYPEELKDIAETVVAVAKDRKFKGYIVLADTLKADANKTVKGLRGNGIKHIEILSGDKHELVDNVAAELSVDRGYGDLLPQDKVEHISRLKSQGNIVAFVGDGINDAPVLALSDVGIAMGSMGSDVAVETADIVIRADEPSKVVEAITISRRTRGVVKQNISLAIGVKIAVMLLGLFGLANLWEAVFADSGVALLAVLNSTRIFGGVRL